MKNEELKINGVTLIELLVVVGILVILSVFAIPAIYNFQKESDLNDNSGEIINTLKLAKNRTLASEGASKWGVYFTTSTVPHQYVLFKGENFASKITSFDEVSKLAKTIEFSEISFASGFEVVFERVTGGTYKAGKVSLRVKTNPEKSKTIYIDNSGKIELSTSSVSDANRVTDSRHVHFNYSRQISTTTEKLILTFEGGVTEEIIIADFIKDGQINWQREINVGGELQKIKITTHSLNNPDTQFSIHRDRRYNTKSLNIDINGDPYYPDQSPTLIRYEATGVTSRGNSIIYVSDPVWQ